MVHGLVVKLGYDANIPFVNALIAMYMIGVGRCPWQKRCSMI
jgi:hypothetical protein